MIRRLTSSDKAVYMEMAEEFYHSPAVLHPIAREKMEAAFAELVSSDRYMEGYLLLSEGAPAGYALLSKTMTQEAGGLVLWVEELYLRPAFRGKGLGNAFFAFLERQYPDVKRFRLEVTEENTGAARLYRSLGYEEFPYLQMVKE